VVGLGFSPCSSVPSVVKGFGSGPQRRKERVHSAGRAKEPSPGAEALEKLAADPPAPAPVGSERKIAMPSNLSVEAYGK
jgi:hypothetical protein